jgi:hypothetical protein
MHAKSAVAFAVLAVAASAMALPVTEQTQNIAARDVESYQVEARDVDFDLDARDLEDYDLEAREFDFDEFDAREFDFDDFDARDFYDFDLEEREWFDEELFERAPQATTSAAPSATSSAAPATQTVVIPDTETTIIVTTKQPVCRSRNIFGRMKRKLSVRRARSRARSEAKRLKNLAVKNRKKNKGKKTEVADAPKPTITAFVLPTGALYKDTKTETGKNGSKTIHREVTPKPTKCPKGSKKGKRSLEMDELD